MGRAVRIESKEQYIRALHVLDHTKGMWRGVGPSSDPVLLLTDEQFDALVAAGVVASNGKKVEARGQNRTSRRTKP